MRLGMERILQASMVYAKEIQITLDDDFNVPDAKPDIEAIVREWGNVYIDSVKVGETSVHIKGNLDFAAGYLGKGVGSTALVKMTGGIAFDDDYNLPDGENVGNIECSARLDDLNIKEVNSRKISVRAIVTLVVTCLREEWKEFGCELDVGQEENVRTKQRKLSYTQMCVNMKDNLRIRQNMPLPAGLPNIGEVRWEELSLRNVSTSVTDDGLVIGGELAAFVMYEADTEIPKMQWYEGSVPFEERIAINGVNPDVVCHVKYHTTACNVEAKANYDGELRDIGLELVLALDVKGFQDNEKIVLEDAYSPNASIEIATEDIELAHLIMKNNSHCKVNAKIDLRDNEMIQIINCTAKAQIDSINDDEGGIVADGVMTVDIMYVTSLDAAPVRSVKEAIPFSQKLAVKGENADVERDMTVSVDNVSAVMLGNGEVQIKGAVAIDVIEFAKTAVKAVTRCEAVENGQEEFLKAPCMVGFIANGRDNLWTIAKNNHTTVDLIKQENRNLPEHCDDDYIVPLREKLLLVKA